MPGGSEEEGGPGRARLSTGIPEIDDLLGGGVPRGRLSEWVGRGSVGATSLAQRVLARVTTDESFAAWVDVADAFDPASASAAGVALHRLLWVRPPDPVAAFAATEILLVTGGFAAVFLDAARVREWACARETSRERREQKKGRRMLSAPQTWLRLARAAERSHTALVVLSGGGRRESEGLSGAAAGVRLELSSGRAIWEGGQGAPPLLEGLDTRVDVTRLRTAAAGVGRAGRAGLEGAAAPARSRRARVRL